VNGWSGAGRSFVRFRCLKQDVPGADNTTRRRLHIAPARAEGLECPGLRWRPKHPKPNIQRIYP